MKFVFPKASGAIRRRRQISQVWYDAAVDAVSNVSYPLVRAGRRNKVAKTNILKLHAQKTENLTNEKKAEGFLFLAFLKFLGQSSEYLGAFGFIVTR